MGSYSEPALSRRFLAVVMAAASFLILFPFANAQAGVQQHSYIANTTPAQDYPPRGHQAETNPGRTPRPGNVIWVPGGSDIPMDNSGISPETLGQSGPILPKAIDMNGFRVVGLVGPKWPVVVDFAIDSPGAVHLDIVTKKLTYEANIPNDPNRRAYAILHLPAEFVDKLQMGVYQIQAVPPNGSAKNTAPPRLRIYGLGAGEKAVGSVAIDQLSFQPGSVHANDSATYSFHAHSFFNGVRAEFVLTELRNGHVVVEQDQEVKLPPVPQDESPRRTWVAKGKAGEHMLEIRAWRGLENGGDWVVAWSPDIVDVVK